MAGALGLEPRAYGFGDDADKSASGGTTFEVNISTIQNKSPPHSQNHSKNETNREFQQQAYGLLGLRSILPKPSAQKLYHIPLILARIRGRFLASFRANCSQSLSGVNFWKESSRSINFLEDFIISYSLSYLPEMSSRKFWKSWTTSDGDTIFAILRKPQSQPKNWSLIATSVVTMKWRSPSGP